MKIQEANATAFDLDKSIHIVPHSNKKDFNYKHDFMINPGDCCTTFNSWTEIVKDKPKILIYKSFLKWVGGKSKLISQYEKPGIIPKKFGTYFEPFLGGGAMFFYLQSQGKIERALLSDLNEDLITTYNEVKGNLKRVKEVLLEDFANAHSETFYNGIKNKVFCSELYIAARFIYLNKSCRSGIYRVNSKGQFNVPMGELGQKIYQPELLDGANEALNKSMVGIINTSFFNISHLPQAGDFVFLDPPYHQTFKGYNSKIFTEEDQVRLRNICFDYIDDGVNFILCNSDTKFIRDLYSHKFFKIYQVERAGSINSNLGKDKK